jgi:hypothetical protein
MGKVVLRGKRNCATHRQGVSNVTGLSWPGLIGQTDTCPLLGVIAKTPLAWRIRVIKGGWS